MNISALPGAEIVERGLSDLACGRETDAALLVLVGAPRLRLLGLPVPAPPPAWFVPSQDPSPEHRLYERLASSDADSAHSRYNGLIRLLVSFERAAECAS